MISYEQCAGSRRVIMTVFTVVMVGLPAFPGESVRKFYPDDPLLREPASRPVKQLATRHVDSLYDFLHNSFETPRHKGKIVEHGSRTALDANTIGDVPDSTWYTRR